MNKSKLSQNLFMAGNILTFAGAVVWFFEKVYSPYVFSAGVLMLLFVQLKNMAEKRDAEIRERRIARNGVFAAFVLVIGVYFMFTGSNSWVIALLIYALSTLIMTFRMPLSK